MFTEGTKVYRRNVRFTEGTGMFIEGTVRFTEGTVKIIEGTVRFTEERNVYRSKCKVYRGT